jgi:hypothetical protein
METEGQPGLDNALVTGPSHQVLSVDGKDWHDLRFGRRVRGDDAVEYVAEHAQHDAAVGEWR